MKQKLQKKGKTNKGITLIALVITIIMLLILAGVSIATLTGDSGILKQANNAKYQTKMGEETERIELAVTDAKIGDNGYQKLTYENLQNTITHQFGESAKVTENDDGTFLVKVEDRDYNVSSDGKVYLKDKNALSSIITPQNYGDRVNYSANGINDWKIFYNDGNNVFIIASDYLNNKKLPEGLGIVGEGTYKVKWTELLYSELPNQEISKKYKLKSFPENKYAMKAVYSLMDTEKWKTFVNPELADSAIGSPTLEMFCDSWNQKGYTSLYCNNYDNKGYYIGGENASNNIKYDIANDLGYNDKLYFPYQEATEDECAGYWLASTAATDSGFIMRISKAGNINYRHYGVANEGLRPVVCLKSSVVGEKDENTQIWNIK